MFDRSYRSSLVGALIASVIFSAGAGAANDPDSFGRAVRYLDVGISPVIITYAGTMTCPADAICRPVAGTQISQTFNDADRLQIALSAGSTNSMVCFSLTPALSYSFSNYTAAPINAQLTFSINVNIDSAVLSNPFLLNRLTGQPFNGSIAIQPISSTTIIKTIAPNATEFQSAQNSRECVSGMITTSASR